MCGMQEGRGSTCGRPDHPARSIGSRQHSLFTVLQAATRDVEAERWKEQSQRKVSREAAEAPKAIPLQPAASKKCGCGKFLVGSESTCKACSSKGTHSSAEPALVDTIAPAFVAPSVSKRCEASEPSSSRAGMCIDGMRCDAMRCDTDVARPSIHAATVSASAVLWRYCRCGCGGFLVGSDATCKACSKGSSSLESTIVTSVAPVAAVAAVSKRCACGAFTVAGESTCKACSSKGTHSSAEPALVDTIAPAFVAPSVSKRCEALHFNETGGQQRRW